MAEPGFKSPIQPACQTVLHPLNLSRLLSLRNKGPSLTQDKYYTLQSSFPSWPHWVQLLGDRTVRHSSVPTMPRIGFDPIRCWINIHLLFWKVCGISESPCYLVYRRFWSNRYRDRNCSCDWYVMTRSAIRPTELGPVPGFTSKSPMPELQNAVVTLLLLLVPFQGRLALQLPYRIPECVHSISGDSEPTKARCQAVLCPGVEWRIDSVT